MVAPRISETFDPHLLPEPGKWQPVPAVTDREFWAGVDGSTRDAFLAEAERFSGAPWPELTASLWREFARTGNRTRYQDPYFTRRRRLAAAVLAACLTDHERWHAEVLDGVWLLCEETTWCIPPHDPSETLPDPDRPWIDLFVAETAALLAWTHAVLAPRLRELAPIAIVRLVECVRSRLLRPYRATDSWHWLGLDGRHVGNWNTWINSNVLACALLLDEGSEQLAATAGRVLRSLDHFLAGYPDDGGCTEGSRYWWRAGASLFECLEFLHSATGGALDRFGVPLVREIGRYPHRVHIADDWYVNVADADAKLIDDQHYRHHSAQLLYRFGHRVGDPEMVAHGRAMRQGGPLAQPGESLPRVLLALADPQWRVETPRPAPLVSQSWWPQTQLLTARERAGDQAGLFLSIKGGHNGEDHNHNDVGSVIVAMDGQPVLVDAGVGEYTRVDADPAARYTLWTHRSGYHNVPVIDGYEQAVGGSYRARDPVARLGDREVSLTLDLAPAYPPEAGARRWLRTATLDRARATVTLVDTWSLDRTPQALSLHLLAAAAPRQPGPAGTLLVPTPGRPLLLRYDEAELAASVEEVAVTDRRLRRIWGEQLWRIRLSCRRPRRDGEWTLVCEGN